MQAGAFADWRLSVEGSVARPRTFSLAELKQFSPRTQITRHTCEEGWTAIAQWTGVPLSAVLDAVGILPAARFVVYSAYDDWIDSIDLLDALHPQTILAYGMPTSCSARSRSSREGSCWPTAVWPCARSSPATSRGARLSRTSARTSARRTRT